MRRETSDSIEQQKCENYFLSDGAGASQQGVQNRTAATGSLHSAQKV
jgi:hypothetical protein